MIENRQKDREICYAKVILTNTGLIGWIRDISEKGCRIDFASPSKPEIEKEYPFHIIAEESMSGLEVLGTCFTRWIKDGPVFNTVGIEVNSFHHPRDKESFKVLYAYYAQE